MIEGVRHLIPLSATTEAEAIAEVLTIRDRPMAKLTGSWDEAVQAYLLAGRGAGKLSDSTAQTRGIVLSVTGRELALSGPRSLTPAVARRWFELQKAREGISPNTLLDYAAHLRAFCRWCVDSGRMSSDPTKSLELPAREENTRDVFLEVAEVRVLLAAARAAADRDMEWIIALGCECGMRRGEIAACRSAWFDIPRGTVTIPASDPKLTPGETWKRKGRTGRRRSATVPLSSTILELIAHHGLTEPFIVAPAKEWTKSRYRFEFKKRFDKFIKTHSPTKHVTVHDLRRSFASNRVSAGVSIEKIANWMGIHRNTAWARYSRFIPADTEINRGAALVEKPSAPPTPTDIPSRLALLDQLHNAGQITAKERATRRAAILSEI